MRKLISKKVGVPIITLMLLIGIVLPASAYYYPNPAVWQYFPVAQFNGQSGNVTGTHLGILPQADYSPNVVWMWGLQYDPYNKRRIQADAYQLFWEEPWLTDYVKNSGRDVAVVFHNFKTDSNCAADSTFWATQWWKARTINDDTGVPGTYVKAYYATASGCASNPTNPANEVRIYLPRYNMQPNVEYEFLAEFEDRLDLNNWVDRGQVNFDIYRGNARERPWEEENKEYLYKFCYWYKDYQWLYQMLNASRTWNSGNQSPAALNAGVNCAWS